MVDNSFDLVVIGSGPGGYVAAIRAAPTPDSRLLALIKEVKRVGPV